MINNVDPEEIAKFSVSTEDWWDLNGEFKTLHEINPLRIHYINQQASLLGKTVLDVGCGGGILSEGMAKFGAIVTGIDMSQKALNAAQAHAFKSNLAITYYQSTAEEAATKHPGQFDMVTCLEMLEHVPDPTSIVQACSTLVKPGGHIFFSTLNRNPKSYLFAILGAEYLLKLLPKNTHDFAKFIRPSELASWARKAGLCVQDLTGMQYHVFTKKYNLSKDVSVNYLMHCKK